MRGRKKIKEIVNNTSKLKEEISSLNTRFVNPPMPREVLPLTDNLYITCDKRQWMIVETNNKKDKPILFAPNLNEILKVAVNYKIRVPTEYKNLLKVLEDTYKLIDERVPVK